MLLSLGLTLGLSMTTYTSLPAPNGPQAVAPPGKEGIPKESAPGRTAEEPGAAKLHAPGQKIAPGKPAETPPDTPRF